MRADPIQELLTVLKLRSTGARTSEDIFTAPSEATPGGRIFGGQVYAQAILAASRTVAEGRNIHSAHGYFLRPGDAQKPITLSVDRVHDGRSFSTRRTQCYQNGLPILSMIASFQDENPGVWHQKNFPEGITPPEQLPSAAQVLSGFDHPVAKFWATSRSFDIRHVEQPIYFTADPKTASRQSVWMRAIGALPDDKNLHRAALAYASDYSILEPVLRAHGIAWAHPGLAAASLDHAIWWHSFARVDEWLLYVLTSPSASGGRGLATGEIFTRDGKLVATIAQEGMVRIPQVAG